MLTRNIQIRDPFILKKDRTYFMFGSTDADIWKADGVGFDVYSGSDLANWEGPVSAFRPPADFWGKRNFWAPEVHEYKNSYYMFASFAGNGVMRGTAILRAECPTGPYMPWSDGAVTPSDWMCLDGTFFLDDDKMPWIVFCHEWVQITDGTVCAARLSPDLKRMDSEPVTLFCSSDAVWSAKAFSKSNNKHGYVTDGCFLHRMENGTLCMIWSCMGHEGYCLGYAVSESGGVLGPWRQCREPLFAKDGGHGMIFRSYEGKLLMALHSPNSTPNERAVFVEIRESGNDLELC